MIDLLNQMVIEEYIYILKIIKNVIRLKYNFGFARICSCTDTHEVIYKQSFDEDALDNSNNLCKWVDDIIVSPKEVDLFIDYHYEVMNSINYE